MRGRPDGAGGIQLVQIKTLQSLHSKFRVVNESLKKIDFTIITRD